MHYNISNKVYCEPMSGCILLVHGDRRRMAKNYRTFSYWLWRSLVASLDSESLQPVSLSSRTPLGAFPHSGKPAGLSSLEHFILGELYTFPRVFLQSQLIVLLYTWEGLSLVCLSHSNATLQVHSQTYHVGMLWGKVNTGYHPSWSSCHGHGKTQDYA